jgi:SAM-dependent methyltransferase
MSSPAFDELKQTWRQLGAEDPLWAVLSTDGKEGGKWNLDEFLATGEGDVALYHGLIRQHAGAPDQLGDVLDFGCGVGRLVLAWSRRARTATGVDISATMIENATRILERAPNARAVLNERPDLGQFPDGSFDVVATHICLQHIPPQYVPAYIREFGRICRPGGAVAFQLPSRHLQIDHLSRIKRWIVEHLPFGLGDSYRRWKRGSVARFDVYSLPTDQVVAAASAGGLQLAHQEPDRSAGASIESFIYVFTKPGGSGDRKS